jgi:predicted PhzF superfamily epimerase YddE/YHI9
VQQEAFSSGHYDTKFIERYFKPEYLVKEDADTDEVAALMAAYVWQHKGSTTNALTGIATTATANKGSQWKTRRYDR